MPKSKANRRKGKRHAAKARRGIATNPVESNVVAVAPAKEEKPKGPHP